MWGAGFWRSFIGYMSKTWRESELIKYVRDVDPSMRIYTNGIAQMLLYTRDNRGQVEYLPLKYHPRTGRPNSLYVQELEVIESELKGGKAVLAIFSHPERFHIKASTPTEMSFRPICLLTLCGRILKAGFTL